jgi:SecD/SecF fusion protein
MINDAVNQTLSRTILTSLTAWIVVVILYIFGGEGLHGFAFALVVGFLSGTYSTVYIASPILIDWASKAPAPPKGGTPSKTLVASRTE